MLNPRATPLRLRNAPRLCITIVSIAGLACVAPAASAQGTTWRESWTGSEWEIYTRALGARGELAAAWSIRPLAPGIVRDMAARVPATHAWSVRLPRRDSLHRIALLRPALGTSVNSGYAWGSNDAAVWQGRGLTAWTTAGVEGRWHFLSARMEPLVAYAANSEFELRPGGAPTGFESPVNGIDVPQRFGDGPLTTIDPGQSYVRVDVGPAAAGFSTANVVWGPGIRHSLLFGANAPGFPHLFVGTNRPIRTPVGSLAGQVLYASLSESNWARPSVIERRFSAGLVATWSPFDGAVELGASRFYHRPWPSELGLQDLLVPLGSAFYDEEYLDEGISDNQLATVFARLEAPQLGLELFGEFGRNDRAVDLRDIAVEPEHNAAWMLGLLHATRPDSSNGAFWTTRIEVVNARASRIQALRRPQALFYTHGRILQGHTHRGQLLGTPLGQESGGAELAVDRWAPWGRAGIMLTERQLPGDRLVGMPAGAERSQWEAGGSATLFRQGADLHGQAGYVWDINRFPGRTVGNFYLRLGLRSAFPEVIRW